MIWRTSNENQAHFENILYGSVIILRLLLKALAFSPFIIVSALVTSPFVTLADIGWTWLASVAVLSYGQYQAIFYLKGLMIALRNRENDRWRIVFIGCVAYTCMPPAVLAFRFFCDLVPNSPLAWGLATFLTRYIYLRYRFLEDWAPKAATWIYRKGVRQGSRTAQTKETPK